MIIEKTTPKMQTKRKYTKHECDYKCDRPRCIKRQRDELVKMNEIFTEEFEAAHKLIYELQNELAQKNVSRHWILRKLGL